MRLELGRPLGRRSVAAASARLDDHEVVGAQAQRLLAADHALERPRVQRDAEWRAVPATGEAVRRHHATVEHAGERELRGQDAIGAAESEAAAMSAVAPGAEAQRLLLDHDR